MIIQNTAKLLAASVIMLAISSCSIFGKNEPESLPLPPRSINESGPLMLPQLGNPVQPLISESAAADKNRSESQLDHRTYSEDRGPGGSVNKISVDNPHAPDYTLSPPQQPYDTNNNPDEITTPSWGYRW